MTQPMTVEEARIAELEKQLTEAMKDNLEAAQYLRSQTGIDGQSQLEILKRLVGERDEARKACANFKGIISDIYDIATNSSLFNVSARKTLYRVLCSEKDRSAITPAQGLQAGNRENENCRLLKAIQRGVVMQYLSREEASTACRLVSTDCGKDYVPRSELDKANAACAEKDAKIVALWISLEKCQCSCYRLNGGLDGDVPTSVKCPKCEALEMFEDCGKDWRSPAEFHAAIKPLVEALTTIAEHTCELEHETDCECCLEYSGLQHLAERALDHTKHADCGKDYVPKAQLDAVQEQLTALEGELEEKAAELEKANAACAEMRGILEDEANEKLTDAAYVGLAGRREHALSTDCGKGWCSPEAVENIRKQTDDEWLAAIGDQWNQLTGALWADLDGAQNNIAALFRHFEENCVNKEQVKLLIEELVKCRDYFEGRNPGIFQSIKQALAHAKEMGVEV